MGLWPFKKRKRKRDLFLRKGGTQRDPTMLTARPTTSSLRNGGKQIPVVHYLVLLRKPTLTGESERRCVKRGFQAWRSLRRWEARRAPGAAATGDRFGAGREADGSPDPERLEDLLAGAS